MALFESFGIGRGVLLVGDHSRETLFPPKEGKPKAEEDGIYGMFARKRSKKGSKHQARQHFANPMYDTNRR